MISVLFFCTRQSNLETILSRYEDFNFIDEILIIHLDNLNKDYSKYTKAKFIFMPKNADLGLLSRYTFALSCKNRMVFMQDDDWVYSKKFFDNIINKNYPIAGALGRFFEDGKYKIKKDKSLKFAPIVLTTGVLVDTIFLPKVIEYAKDFFTDYQNVFNGEDIFMSYAISYITGIEKFPIFTNKTFYEVLSTEGRELSKSVNTKKSRTDITKQIIDYFWSQDE